MSLDDLLDGYTYPWLVVLAGSIVATLVALIAHGLLFALLRRLSRLSVFASTIVEFSAAPARAVLPLLALQLVIAEAPPDLPFRILATHTLAILLIAALTWLALKVIGALGEAVVRLNPASVSDNLQARRVQTQTRVLTRTVKLFVLLIGAGSVLMTFPEMRQLGTSLLASAGVAGLVAGIAARPVLGNLIAGLQIALTQPIRLDDVVIIENEWGRIEEITATYVVVKIWDERRLVVPLQWIIEHPFQNWTRTGSQLLGTVFLWLDYGVPMAELRAELQRVCSEAPEWDGRVAMIQVTEANERAIQLRALVSAADASKAWDLRCRVREALIEYLRREHPESLPRVRATIDRTEEPLTTEATNTPPLQAGKGDSAAIKEPTHPEVQAIGDARASAEAQDETTGKGG
ncbi:MAG TPA: mechanosensitive ion channel family protein [Burkholderiales bacterium]|nr:mechanosensitive ion channel family protein [Burkholderiales bacterium]